MSKFTDTLLEVGHLALELPGQPVVLLEGRLHLVDPAAQPDQGREAGALRLAPPERLDPVHTESWR